MNSPKTIVSRFLSNENNFAAITHPQWFTCGPPTSDFINKAITLRYRMMFHVYGMNELHTESEVD